MMEIIKIIKEVWNAELGLNRTEGASQIIKGEYIRMHGTPENGHIINESIKIQYGYYEECFAQSSPKYKLTGRATITGMVLVK